MAEDVIVTAALCTILGFVLGMTIGRATSPKTFNPLQTYVECYACECRCIHPGQDDGQTTCWKHHDCSDGSCTHQDNDDDYHESVYRDWETNAYTKLTY